MSLRHIGFYFSANADGSANDKTIYAGTDGNCEDGNIRLSIRYKNSEPNSLYEIELDSDDLRVFGRMCLDLADNLDMID